MGNTAFDSLVTSTVSSIGQDIPWSKQFSMLDKQPLNNTYILHHIPTNNSYKVKHMTLNKTQHQEIFRQIDIKKNTPSPFVTKLEKTQQYTVKGYCSQHQQVFLMYKYVQTNLKEEILNRRFRQEKFLQQEIQVIMESGVKGISYLHEIGCTPKGLNTSQILLTQQRAVLINDPWLSVGSPLAHTGQGSNNKQSSNEQTNGSKILSIPVQDYPSPQKILYMNELIEQYNEWLSQLFTFGMIVLETIFMTSLNEQLYDKSQKKIYYHKVKEKVQQIVQGQQMDKSNNGGGESLLSEIKQDLRRLLSHQPKIRESVYLKYKKSHGSYLFLKKPKDEFKLNQLQRKEGMNRVQNQKPNIQSNEMRQLIKNVNVYDTIDKKLNIQQLSKKYSKQGDNNLSKILRQGEKSNNNNKFSKQNWVLNSINEQYMNMSKEKQTNNRFRVVSSSLPHGSKFNTNTHANNNNYFQVSKLNTIGDINNNNINNNINNTLGYRQLGGAPSSSINREYSQYRPNSFLSKFNTNTSINNPINNYTNVCSNNNYTKIEQLNNNNNISNNNNNNISNNNNNNISNNNNNNISNKPSELFTGQSNNYLTKIYSNINHTNHQDTNNNNIVRRGQLSPKKQSLVQKQSEILKYPYSSYKNRTTSTIPSSPYLSTISTNAYQSQISPLFGQQYNKSQYDNFSQLKVMNMNENNYNNNSSLNNNNNKNVNNNQINLPLNMVTRSSSSYVLQNGKVGGQNNISNSNYNNNSNSNNNSNYQYSYKLAQTNTNTNWTYQSMIKNNNNQRNALGNNEQRVSQFKQKVQEKNPYPSKISLSQFYLNKYNNPNQQTNQTHVNNNNNLNINTQVDFTTKRSQYYSINNNPTTDQYINPTHNYNNNTTYNPSSYEAFKQNFSNYSSPNYYNIPNNNTNLYNNNTSNTYQQQIQPSKTSSIINQQNPSYHKLPSSKELSNFNFREVGSLYCDQSHFLNDKESIVIQSYNTGGFNNKYQSNNRSQLPVNTFSNNNSNFPTFNNINNTFNNNSNIPTTSPKSSFQINHSMINNTRNQGKSFSSMDQDLKQLRKFAQKQPVQKKPNSSYSSSQKVSLIDKIYDPQVMASFDRRSFQNKQDYFGTSYTQQQQQGTINNRSSQDINNHRTTEKPLHSRNNSSQNYLQTPQRYPNKYKLNSTIRQASCEDSGVNQSHNNSNREDSYQHQKVYPNTQISKYQLMNDQRRFSQRKVEDNQHRQDLMQRPIQIDRQGKKQTNFNIQNNSNANAPTFKNIEQTHQNAHENNPNQQKVTLYADGSRFIGSTDQNGQSHGFGTLYYPDGHVAYEGQWQHGDFNGKGILFNPYELKMEKSYDYRDLTKMDEYIKQFEGIFNHDVKSGKGVLKMHNNEVFEGEFSNDLPNGKGKFYCSDGNIVEGVWQRGYLQQTY